MKKWSSLHTGIKTQDFLSKSLFMCSWGITEVVNQFRSQKFLKEIINNACKIE